MSNPVPTEADIAKAHAIVAGKRYPFDAIARALATERAAGFAAGRLEAVRAPCVYTPADLAEARELVAGARELVAGARELVAGAPTDAMRVARDAHEHSEAWARHIAAALAERERRVWAAIKGMAECGGFGMDNYGVIYRSAHPPRTSAEALCAILEAAREATK